MPHLEIAVFAHGDYCDRGKTYVTKHIDFTNSQPDLCSFVKNVEATHGGDYPECYELVLYEARENLSWKNNANKSLVMIGDAEPHKKDEEQNTRKLDWEEEVQNLYKKVLFHFNDIFISQTYIILSLLCTCLVVVSHWLVLAMKHH